MEDSMALTQKVETSLWRLEGNKRCAECDNIFPEWASVSFGILICLTCAGKHRSLGVNVSFVKSLRLDSWSSAEKMAVELGGNKQWRDFCENVGILSLFFCEKYQSPAADSYKQRLFRNVKKVSILSLELEGRDSFDTTVVSAMKSLSIQTFESNVFADMPQQVSRWKKYDCNLGLNGTALGFSLSKTKGGYAEVCKVIEGGEAEKSSVRVGSFIIAINNQKASGYNEIVDLIKTVARPIRFRFIYRKSATA